MCAGQVDDDRARRRLEGGGLVAVEAEEEEVRPGGGRAVVRRERRQAAVEPRVERGRRPAGERVRAEGDRLELRVREHPVERLLAGVAGAAEDRDRDHPCVLYT